MTEFFGWLSSGEGAGILGVGLVSLLGGYAIGFGRGWANCFDGGEQGKTIRLLQDSLMTALEREAISRQLAADRLYLIERYEAELEEDDAVRREEAAWKEGMDERIWRRVSEQIELHRSRYATVEELIGSRIVEEA